MSEVARRRRRGMSRRIGIAAIALSLVAGACSSDDNSSDTSPADTSDSSSEEVDIVAEAKRITELAKAGLVYAAQDSGTASSDIIAQTEWFGPTEPVSSLEEGKNVQVIMCSSGTACEVAANFVVEAAKSVGWTADIIDGQFNPEVWLTHLIPQSQRSPMQLLASQSQTLLLTQN